MGLIGRHRCARGRNHSRRSPRFTEHVVTHKNQLNKENMELKELIDGFSSVATASVADAVDKVAGTRGYMSSEIKPRINEKRICGPAFTVLEVATDEFLPPQHALDLIDESPEGSIVCISIGGVEDVAV